MGKTLHSKALWHTNLCTLARTHCELSVAAKEAAASCCPHKLVQVTSWQLVTHPVSARSEHHKLQQSSPVAAVWYPSRQSWQVSTYHAELATFQWDLWHSRPWWRVRHACYDSAVPLCGCLPLSAVWQGKPSVSGETMKLYKFSELKRLTH